MWIWTTPATAHWPAAGKIPSTGTRSASAQTVRTLPDQAESCIIKRASVGGRTVRGCSAVQKGTDTMNESIKARALDYAARCRDEQAELLRTLGRLPAPSRQEDLRAAFCRDWLQKQGAQDVTIDAVKNVICRLGPAECEDLVVFAAHTDVVFPDLDLLPVREEDGRLYAPGIGDDTANLVNLLLAA